MPENWEKWKMGRTRWLKRYIKQINFGPTVYFNDRQTSNVWGQNTSCFLCLLSTLRSNRRYNKNALRRGFKSRFLGDSIRNKEAIISTPNRIYSLKVFHSLLYRRSSTVQDVYFLYLIRLSTRVSDHRKYVCGCKVCTCQIHQHSW